MTPERMRYIAETVTEFAEAHGIEHEKSVDEIIEDLEYVDATGALEFVTYLFEYIDSDDLFCDNDEVWALVESVWADNPWGTV